jgi:hypothetical protein
MDSKFSHPRVLFIAYIAVELFHHRLQLLLERLFLGCFDGSLFFNLGGLDYFYI